MESDDNLPANDPRSTPATRSVICDARLSGDRASGPVAPGTMLGDWRIERTIGCGGMGTVYEAVHVVIGKRAAIKVVRADMTPKTIERAVLEAMVVNQVGHPNIVDIFHIGRLDDNRPYLVMELLHGQNLGDRMAKGRMLPTEAIDLMLDVCAGLGAAHAHGVVHRDLKPENIFLAETPAGGITVKLIDWGIAKRIDCVELTSTTLAGTLIGTPEYMSPEQARGQHVDGKSDIYALGSIAYELFLEGAPFVADNIADLLAMHLTQAPPSPSELWPDIPVALGSLMLRMLAKSPADRPSLDELTATLRAVRAELETRRAPVRIRPPSHRVPLDAHNLAWGVASGAAPTSQFSPLGFRSARWHRALVGVAGLALFAVAMANHLLGSDAVSPAGATNVRATPAPVFVDPLGGSLPDPVTVGAAAPVETDALVEAAPVTLPAGSLPVKREARAAESRVPDAARAKRSSDRRRSAPRIDPDDTIDPFE